MATDTKSALGEYLLAVSRRWVALMTGSVPIALYTVLTVGFPDSSRTQYFWNHIPQWAVVSFAFLGLIHAQFGAWREIRAKHDSLATKLTELQAKDKPEVEDGLEECHWSALTGNPELPYKLVVHVSTKKLIRAGIRLTCDGNIYKVEAEKRRGKGASQTIEDPVTLPDPPNSYIFLVYNHPGDFSRRDLWFEARLYSFSPLNLVAVEQVKPGEASTLREKLLPPR